MRGDGSNRVNLKIDLFFCFRSWRRFARKENGKSDLLIGELKSKQKT